MTGSLAVGIPEFRNLRRCGCRDVSLAEQAKIAIASRNAVLAEAGMDARTLTKVTICLADESPQLVGGFRSQRHGDH